MKRTIKLFLTAILVLACLLGTVSCKPEETSSENPVDNMGSEVLVDEYEDMYEDLPSDANTNGQSNTDGQSNGQTNNNSGSGKSWKEVLNSMPKELKGTTIRVMSYREMQNMTGAVKVIDDFTKKTGIKVKWETSGYEIYYQNIQAKVAADEAPDIIILDNTDVAAFSLIQPISACGYDFNDPAWDTSTMNAFTLNGKIYATGLKNSLHKQPRVFYYNKDLLEKYDLEDPYKLWKENKWTFSKFEQICNDYKEETGKVAWVPDDLDVYIRMLGIGYVTFDGTKYISNLKDSRMEAGFKKMNEMVNSGLVKDGFFDQKGFENGEYPFFNTWIVGAGKTTSEFADLKSRGALGVVPYPSIDGKDYYVDLASIQGYAVPKGAKNAKAVPYFLRYYLDATNYDKNSFFFDKKVLEIFEWCMKQPNIISTNCYSSILGASGHKTNRNDLFKQVTTATSEQIPTILSQIAPLFEADVKWANDQLNKLK